MINQKYTFFDLMEDFAHDVFKWIDYYIIEEKNGPSLDQKWVDPNVFKKPEIVGEYDDYSFFLDRYSVDIDKLADRCSDEDE